jgi:hypothetical protein
VAPEKFDVIEFTMKLWVEHCEMSTGFADLFLDLTSLGQEVWLRGKEAASTAIYVLNG